MRPMRETASERTRKSRRGGSKGETASDAASRLDVSPPLARTRLLLILAALAAINLFVYAAVWRFDFVNYDDPQYILKNPHVAAGLTWESISWAFGTGYAANWHPLTWWSYMFDAQIYGVNAGAFHATNVLLHVANTL